MNSLSKAAHPSAIDEAATRRMLDLVPVRYATSYTMKKLFEVVTQLVLRWEQRCTSGVRYVASDYDMRRPTSSVKEFRI